MSKVIASMSVSLDGFVADPKGGVADAFDRYVHAAGHVSDGAVNGTYDRRLFSPRRVRRSAAGVA